MLLFLPRYPTAHEPANTHPRAQKLRRYEDSQLALQNTLARKAESPSRIGETGF
jgi:hypothetical protein